MNQLRTTELVDHIEELMLEEDQADCPVVHHFGPGVYMREVSIPAGVFSIGHHQKLDHLNIMLKGRVIMINPDGSKSDVRAPIIFTAPPGRKVGYIVEDMVWLNVYPTNETDIETLENTYLDKSDVWEKSREAKKITQQMEHECDRVDFKSVLEETGFTEQIAREQSENETDQIDMPEGYRNYRLADSNIEGKGFFLTSPVNKGDIIAPARINGKRTPAGRYVNHSSSPNAKMVIFENNDIYLVADARIEGCKGGSSGEEVTICYRQALSLSRGGEKICLE